MLKLRLTQDNVRTAFFNVSVQWLRARRMQKLNKQTLKSESPLVWTKPTLLSEEKNVLTLTRSNVCIAFLLKTLQCFFPLPL